MNTYIQKDSSTIYVELGFLLDENYSTGTSWQDYLDGKWVLLSEDQLIFRDENPTASVREVFNMRIDESPIPPIPEVDELERAKKVKLNEIFRQDQLSNKFFISVQSKGVEIKNQEIWVDKDLRNSLLNMTLPALQKDGETHTKLWTNTIPPESVDIPIDWGLKNLPLVELYAKRTYDLKSSNEAAVYNAKTVEEVNSIDVTKNYPLFLTFELNLDIDGTNS